MPKILTEHFKEKIRTAATATSPYETGGLFIRDQKGVLLKNCPNISPAPDVHYLVDPDDINEAKQIGEIIAYWHSHPKGNDVSFHLGDIAIAEKLKINSIVYINELDTFIDYEPVGFEIPYEGRPYFFKVLDCLTLVIDFYEREYNISFPYMETHILDVDVRKWHDIPPSEYTDNGAKNYLLENGFVEVNDLKRGDILLIQPPKISFPCHFAVYMGEDRFLNQSFTQQSLSKIMHYDYKWKKRTKYIFRHSKLM